MIPRRNLSGGSFFLHAIFISIQKGRFWSSEIFFVFSFFLQHWSKGRFFQPFYLFFLNFDGTFFSENRHRSQFHHQCIYFPIMKEADSVGIPGPHPLSS
jgi:hypothetical protein